MAYVVSIIILICLAVIAYIVIRKFPQLTLVKTEASYQLKNENLKKDMYEKRLKRQMGTFFVRVLTVLKPAFSKLVEWIKGFYSSIKDKEEEYRHKLLHQDFKDEVDKEQKFSLMLTQAKESLAEKNYEDAEAKLIDILKLEPQFKEAYHQLARLYWEKKDYEHAIETYSYLLKISADSKVYQDLAAIAEERGDLKEAEKNYLEALGSEDQDVEVYYNLATLYKQQENMDKSVEMINQALVAMPNNPKYLDFLFEISIMSQDKKTAKEAFDKLTEVNPDNNKLAEYQETIDSL
jgi:tetratricopeptide (TPR) repeat protein